MRRYYPPFDGARYIVDKRKKRIHDIDNESTMCNLDLIKEINITTLDTDEEVKYFCQEEGYKGCHWCNPQFDDEIFFY